MKTVKLGKICKVVSGSTPERAKAEYWGGNIPWVTPKEISRLTSPYLFDTFEKITESGFKSCSTEMLPVGSLLLSSRAPIGLLAINKIPVCTNQGFKSLVPTEAVTVEFLYYYLKHNIKSLQAKGNGATFKELPKPTVENFPIVLIPLDDQIRIAHLLGKVEGLIAQRKQHLRQLDDLLRSVFLEMFGDPVRNEKGWKQNNLSRTCLKITDGTHDTPERIQEGVVFITGKHIRPFVVDYSNSDFVSTEDHQVIYSRCDPRYGDVLYTNIGVNLGTAAMNTVNYEFSMKNVALLRPDNSWLHSRFLEHYLNHDRLKTKIISELSSGGAQKFLGLGQIKKIGVFTPPIDLQNQFATIVEKVEGIKAHYQQNLSELENLYGALSQKAFKGELDLRCVPLLAAADLPDSDQHHSDKQDKPAPINIKAGAAKSTDNIGKPAPFANKSFEEFLSTRKDKVLTVAALWRELKQVNFENQPPNFESFKNLVVDYLDEGRWLEQVYAEVPVDDDIDGSEVEKLKEKKVALRIRDDS